MTMSISDKASGDLGGRLPLLSPSEFDPEQRELYDGLTKLILPEAEAGGFIARLDDGRFIGPFNALLRAPRIAGGFGQWTAQINKAELSGEVRQVVILAVGATWSAEYEIYAHEAAARAAGVPDAAIDAIGRKAEPAGVSAEARVAYRLAVSVLEQRTVADRLYDEAVATFEVAGVIAILSLIAQYQFISSILTTFRVPSP